MSPTIVSELLAKYSQLRIAIVGDFCLDRYLEIDPTRGETSIETGLPVYNVVNVRAQPGAAGTVLANLVALGIGKLLPIGFCGEDGEGWELQRALRALPGVDLSHFAVTPERRTFTYCKPLVVESGREPCELNRLDSKNWTPTPVALQKRLAASIEAIASEVDAIILMDQVDVAESGVVTEAVRQAAWRAQERHPGLLLVADSRRGLHDYPPMIFKMNAAELCACMGQVEIAREEEVLKLAAGMAEKSGRRVFVTLAERGIVGAEPGAAAIHRPSLPVRGAIDIVGAGDSVTANLTAALAAGAEMGAAMEIAMSASSIVIHKLGTTGTASVDEILRVREFSACIAIPPFED